MSNVCTALNETRTCHSERVVTGAGVCLSVTCLSTDMSKNTAVNTGLLNMRAKFRTKNVDVVLRSRAVFGLRRVFKASLCVAR